MDAQHRTSRSSDSPKGGGRWSDDEPDGPTANPATSAAHHAAQFLAELKSYATYFLSAKADGLIATGKRIAILAALGVVGLIVAAGVLFAACFLLLGGIADALG